MRFNRASAHLSNVVAILAFLVLACAGAALAQTVDTAPIPNATTTEATTVLGWVLRALLGAAFIAGAWAAVKLSAFLKAKTLEVGASTGRAQGWNIINIVWLKIQAVASKILAKERPLMEKILADGQVTHDEFEMFVGKITIDIREIAVEELPILKGILGGSEGALNTILHGWAAMVANKLLNDPGSTPTKSPTAQAPTKEQALAAAVASPT